MRKRIWGISPFQGVRKDSYPVPQIAKRFAEVSSPVFLSPRLLDKPYKRFFAELKYNLSSFAVRLNERLFERIGI